MSYYKGEIKWSEVGEDMIVIGSQCKYDWIIVLLKKKTIIMVHQNKTIISR
jgi:hypothetical protein